jgi:hypothetical protein
VALVSLMAHREPSARRQRLHGPELQRLGVTSSADVCRLGRQSSPPCLRGPHPSEGRPANRSAFVTVVNSDFSLHSFQQRFEQTA